MTIRTGFCRPVCAAAVVASFTLAAAAQVFADDDKLVSFDGALSGSAQWDGASSFANCQGAGSATHLGLTTSECTAVLDLAHYGPSAECVGEGTGNGLPNVNTATLTAANGDRLVLVSADLACEIEPATSFHARGVWTVNPSMSTGRFAGATGTGNCEANVDFEAGVFEITYSGEISY